MSEKQLLELLGTIERTFCSCEQERELEQFPLELLESALKEGHIKIDETGFTPTLWLTKKGKKYLEKSRVREENQSRYHY